MLILPANECRDVIILPTWSEKDWATGVGGTGQALKQEKGETGAWGPQRAPAALASCRWSVSQIFAERSAGLSLWLSNHQAALLTAPAGTRPPAQGHCPSRAHRTLAGLMGPDTPVPTAPPGIWTQEQKLSARTGAGIPQSWWGGLSPRHGGVERLPPARLGPSGHLGMKAIQSTPGGRRRGGGIRRPL